MKDGLLPHSLKEERKGFIGFFSLDDDFDYSMQTKRKCCQISLENMKDCFYSCHVCGALVFVPFYLYGDDKMKSYVNVAAFATIDSRSDRVISSFVQ